MRETPVCGCHGEPMLWQKDTRRKASGFWLCAVKHREYIRRWRAANPEKVRESFRRWRAANPEKARESFRRWRAANLERERERRRLYREAHPEKFCEYERRRRARKAGAPSDGHTREEVFARSGGRCALCGRFLPRFGSWHEDHIVPLSRGGSDTLDNVQATCPPCNLRKGARVA